MGVRNRVGRGLSYRPGRLHNLAELVPCNRFLGSLKVEKFGLRLKVAFSNATVSLIPTSGLVALLSNFKQRTPSGPFLAPWARKTYVSTKERELRQTFENFQRDCHTRRAIK